MDRRGANADEAETLLFDETKSDFDGDSTIISGYTSHPSRARRVVQQVCATLRLCVLFTLPSFLRPWLIPDTNPPPRTYPTAYLDGLRGLASFSVYLFHLAYVLFDIKSGFGVNGHYSPLRLPIIRLIWDGTAAVSIFFIISGAALSLKPLQQIHARQYQKLLLSFSSALFRRPLRLFMPCIASTFIVFVLGRLGAYDATQFYYSDRSIHAGYTDGGHKHPIYADFGQDFGRWLLDCWIMVTVIPFESERWASLFDAHLWTIPTEFRGSIALFLVQVATARLQICWRMVVVAVLVVICIPLGRWELILFFSGFWLVEINMLIQMRRATPAKLPIDYVGIPNTRLERKQRLRRVGTNLLRIVLVIFSAYLLSSPGEDAYKTPGYEFLGSLFPATISKESKTRFFQIPGAALLVFAVGNANFLTRFFSLPLFNYLGKISFAIYLVHGMVNHLLGFAIFWHVYQYTGHTTPIQVSIGFVIGLMINTVAVIWAADLFWRAVDIPSVKLGKWVEDLMTMKDP